MREFEDRFWSKVDKTGDCWEWNAAKLPFGYGLFGSNGKTFRAHRVAWELTFGKIEGRLLVCHKCDNPPCVNPDHLFLGTHKDNFDDMVSKNRSQFEVKLSEEIVRKMVVIYNSHLGIRMRHLAKEFGVDTVTVSAIFTNKTWKTVHWNDRKTGESLTYWLERNCLEGLTDDEVEYWRKVFKESWENDKRTLENKSG